MAKSRSSAPLIIVFVLVVAAGAGGWWWFNRAAEKDPEYSTVTIARGDVTQAVTATGDIQSVTSVEVSSQISGLIKEVLVDFNDVVKKGDVLARIDPATYVSRLNQARAQLANTTASSTLARLNFERVKTLRDQNLVTVQELDQSRAQLEQTDAQLLIQKAAVEAVEVDLSRCTLVSPIDGVVLSRQAEPGKTVAASLNAPTLFVVANDLTQMRIGAAIAEADVGNIAVDQPVNFSVDAFPNRQFRGKVSQIRNYAKTQQNVVTYETIIDVRNDDLKLRPGMTANVSIIVAQKTGTIKVANSALRARIPESILPRENKTAPAPVAAAASPADTNATAAPPAGSGRAFAGGNSGGGNGGNGRRSGGGGGGGRNPEQMAAIRALMTEAGVEFSPGSRPSPEALAKVRALAQQRGIELPSFLGGGDRNSGAPVTRTVYKLAGDNPKNFKPVPVSVKLGISDGASTEVIDGLAEGDILITAVVIPGAPVASASPQGAGANNPFSGRSGFGGGGPPAGGGRGR